MTPGRDDVRSLLQEHAPTTPAEASHRVRMLALLHAEGDPFARDHWRPGHFTASAFVLAPARDALLLIRHRALGRWLQPGGHVEAQDSDLAGAARREVCEETGLAIADLVSLCDGVFDVDVHAIPERGAAPPHEHFDLRFLFAARTRALAASSEVCAASWVPLAALPELTSDESVRRACRKLAGRGRADA